MDKICEWQFRLFKGLKFDIILVWFIEEATRDPLYISRKTYFVYVRVSM